MKLADRLADAPQFVSTSAIQPITISVFFCDSYSAANEIAKANSFPYQPKAKWSLNGDLLYIVASEDEEKRATSSVCLREKNRLAVSCC